LTGRKLLQVRMTFLATCFFDSLSSNFTERRGERRKGREEQKHPLWSAKSS
jgi:hypothetical protein